MWQELWIPDISILLLLFLQYVAGAYARAAHRLGCAPGLQASVFVALAR
jgi:hypothetical protein